MRNVVLVLLSAAAACVGDRSPDDLAEVATENLSAEAQVVGERKLVGRVRVKAKAFDIRVGFARVDPRIVLERAGAVVGDGETLDLAGDAFGDNAEEAVWEIYTADCDFECLTLTVEAGLLRENTLLPRVMLREEVKIANEGLRPIDPEPAPEPPPLRTLTTPIVHPEAPDVAGLLLDFFDPLSQAEPARLVTVAGENGWVVADVATGDTVLDDFAGPPNPLGPTYGAQPLARGDVRAVFAFGAWGATITHWDAGLGAFGPEEDLAGGNVTDGSPRGGDAASGGLVFVDNTGNAIRFLEFDDGPGRFVVADEAIGSERFPGASGNVVSAAQKADGALLLVTDGDPGQLWHLPASAPGPATLVGDVGGQPRRVRCLGDLVVVSCFGGLGFGRLAVFGRDADGGYSPRQEPALGPRPVGIDLKRLESGDLAVASTAFLRDQYRITVYTPSGGLLSDELVDLPEVCANPGHAVWLEDYAFGRVVVTCNGSGHVVVIPTDP